MRWAIVSVCAALLTVMMAQRIHSAPAPAQEIMVETYNIVYKVDLDNTICWLTAGDDRVETSTSTCIKLVTLYKRQKWAQSNPDGVLIESGGHYSEELEVE